MILHDTRPAPPYLPVPYIPVPHRRIHPGGTVVPHQVRRLPDINSRGG